MNVVDSVGGITICPTHDMNDKLANLHVKKGCQHADGGWRSPTHAPGTPTRSSATSPAAASSARS